MIQGSVSHSAKLGIVLLVVTTLLFSLYGNPVRSESTFSTEKLSQRSTPEPTRIPLPSSPETLIDVQALMFSDADCHPPCFWGFRPGYTLADEILAFVQPEIDDSNMDEKYEIEYFFTRAYEKDWTVTILFNVEDELLSMIDVTLHEPSEWLPSDTFQLSTILVEMDVLPEAYLFISLPQRRLYVTLVYDDAGVVTQYAYKLGLRGYTASPTGDEPYLLCPHPVLNDFTMLWFQDGNGRDLYEYKVAITNSSSDWSVEQMTDLTIEQFVDQIITNPRKCIELHSYYELLEQGYEF